MSSLFSRTSHALAIIWLGIMAGFFATYSANVNIAMLEMNGEIYATVQSAFNRNVRHALFFAFFFGPPLWCLLSLTTAWSARRQTWWWMLLVTAISYGAGIIFFTREVNLPINAIVESWSPQAVPSNWALYRDDWNTANLLRSYVSFFSFALAVIALTLRVGQGETIR